MNYTIKVTDGKRGEHAVVVVITDVKSKQTIILGAKTVASALTKSAGWIASNEAGRA